MNTMFTMNILTDYTVMDISSDNISIKADGNIDFGQEQAIVQQGMEMKIDGSGSQNGQFEVNPKDGMVKTSNVDQVMEMNMKMKANKSTCFWPMTLQTQSGKILATKANPLARERLLIRTNPMT